MCSGMIICRENKESSVECGADIGVVDLNADKMLPRADAEIDDAHRRIGKLPDVFHRVVNRISEQGI